jgi:hypothetical protein
MLGLLGAFGAAVLYGVGTVLQAEGVRPDRDSRLYVAGLVLDALGFAASVAALRSLPLFVVESAIASSVAVTALVAVVFLGARVVRAEALALVAVAAGLVALAVSALPGPSAALATSDRGWIVVAVVPAVVVGVVGWRLPGRTGGLVLALAAGLGFGGTGIAARVLVVATPWWRTLGNPALWALAGFGALSLVAFGLALQRTAVTAVAAVTVTVETVVPTIVGLLWLGDRVRPGLAWLTVLGLVLTLAGCLTLARYAAPAEAAPVAVPS